MVRKETFLVVIAVSLLIICKGYAQNLSSDPNRAGQTRQAGIILLNEGFENNGSLMPEDWSNQYISGTSDWVAVTGSSGIGVAYAGERKIRFTGSAGNKTILSTPPINCSSGYPIVKFWHGQRADENGVNNYLRVYYKTFENDAWTLLEEYLDEVDKWTERAIALPNGSATYYVGFEAELVVNVASSGVNQLNLDEVSIIDIAGVIDADVESVINPQQGIVYGLSATEQVKIAVRNAGQNPLSDFDLILEVNGTVIATETYTGTPIPSLELIEYTFTPTLDLSAAIDYDIKVTVVAADDETEYNNSKTIKVIHVSCPTPTSPINSFPWIDSFERFGAMPLSDYPCWTVENYSGISWGSVTRENLGTFPPYDGNLCVRNSGSASNWSKLITPPFDLTALSTPALKFWYGIRQSALASFNNSELRIFYKTTENGEWILLEEYLEYTFLQSEPWGYVEAIMTLPEKSAEYYIAFEVNGNGSSMFMDYVWVFDLPEVDAEIFKIISPAKGININLTEEEHVKVSIRNAGFNPLSVFDLQVEVNGVVVATETYSGEPIPSIGMVDYTLTSAIDLSGDGDYELTVTIVAQGDTNTSNDAKTNVITNQYCPVVNTFPFFEGFETTLFPPKCWTNYDNAGTSPTYGYWQRTTTAAAVYEGTGAAESTNYAGPMDRWLVSPQIAVPNTGSLILDFWSRNSNVNAVLTIFVSTGDNHPADPSYVQIKQLTDDELSNTYKKISIPLSEYMGQNIYIAFRYGNVASSGTWHIDNIEIREVGTIVGTVTDGTNPLENAKVEIPDTDFFAFTDENGYYEIYSVEGGEYELKAEKLGYQTITKNVTVLPTGNSIHNFVLPAVMLPYQVSGKVIGNDEPDGLEDVEVIISFGIEEYTTFTDENGDYLFPAIFGAINGVTYNIEAKLTGYNRYNSTITVFEDDLIHDITLIEIMIPPIKVVAQEFDDENVVITWEPPGTMFFRYDSGVNDGQLGFATGGTRNSVIGSVHRTNAELNAIHWYSTDNVVQPAYDLWIFGLNSDGLPDRTNVIFTVQDIPNIHSQWNTYQFPEPIAVPNGFFMGVSPSNDGFTSIGTDEPSEEYPFMPNENFYCSNYTQYAFTNFTASNVFKNCMIRAEGYSFGKSAQFGYQIASETATSQFIDGDLVINIPSSNPVVVEEPNYSVTNTTLDRAVTNYHVFRLLDGNQNDETLWDDVNLNVSGLTVTDNNWGDAESGVYRWAVKAEYSGGQLSNPRFSNWLPKDMEVQFTVNLTTNSNDPVSGAVVTLFNLQDETYNQTQTANGQTVLFNNVWKGTYNIYVTLDGFDSYLEQNISIITDGTHNVNLIETINNPYGLKVEVEDNDALFMWNTSIPTTYILDDGTAENGIRINANATASYGNQFNNQDNGILTSVDLYGMGSNGGTRTVTLDIYDADRELIGLSDPFVIPNNNWINVPLNNIPYSGTFYAMVRWYETPENTYYLGYDNDGPNANANLSWARTSAGVWSFANVATPNLGAGVFLIRPNAEVFANKSRALIGYTVYLNGDEVISNVQETQYQFTALEVGVYTAGVQAVYSSNESEIVYSEPFEITYIEPQTYTVTYADPENGTLLVTADGVTIPSGAEVLTGTAITITAIPDEGYNIGTITVNGEPHISGETYIITETTTIVATFDIKMFEVTYTVTGQGTLSVTAPGIGTVTNGMDVPHGTLLTITATPDANYELDLLKVNGEDIESGDTHTVISETVIECEFGFVSVKENLLSSVILYPNPFTDEILVRSEHSVVRINIVNSFGQNIKDIVFNGTSIETSNLGRGVYSVTIEINNGEKLVYKMVK